MYDGDWLTFGGIGYQFTDEGINNIEENIVHINTVYIPVKSDKEDAEVKPMSTIEVIENRHFPVICSDS